MKIAPLHSYLSQYLKRHGLGKKFEKQKSLFENNPFHSGLGVELLEPKNMRTWSFRVDRKYRAIFIFREQNTVEIIDINNHYQ